MRVESAGRMISRAIALLRIIAGVVFVVVSTGKFLDHAGEATDFARYGVPVPNFAVYAVGTVEFLGGVLLVVGLLTRPTAILLGANMIGAIATAGRVEGGWFNLGLAPTLLVVMALVFRLGPGRPALERRDPPLRRIIRPQDPHQ